MFSKEWELVVTVTTVCDRKRNGAGGNQWLSMYDRCGLMVLVLCPDFPVGFILRLKGQETRRRHSSALGNWAQLLLS